MFHDKNPIAGSLTRYYTLVVGILLMSWIGTFTLSALLGGHAVIAKAITDFALFFVSLVVQERWVFRGSKDTDGLT